MRKEHVMKRAIRKMMGVWMVCGCLVAEVSARQIGVGDFEDPMVFDFTELTSGTRLGTGNPNPYEGMGVQFTGFVASTNHQMIQGSHLASGFANSPAEPYVVRVRLLDEPALRVGAYVWPESGSSTSITAFDFDGAVIETCIVPSDTSFVGLESSLDHPISYVEWRGLQGSNLSTFPRVDGVRLDVVPEPTTLSLLGIVGVVALLRCRGKAKLRS
jgi:hypothetical protein